MAEPLWKIRKRKGMSVNQLAAKSGVPAISISEYESGLPIRSADLPRLANAMYVEEWDIEIRGDPFPEAMPAHSPHPNRVSPTVSVPTQDTDSGAPRIQPLARASQIEHLLNLTSRHFGKGREALEREIDKALEEMTRREATELLRKYQSLHVEEQARSSAVQPGVQRKRAYLPEGVDEFELAYLTLQKKSGSLVRFTLFDGTKLVGNIIGFSPYAITLRDLNSGDEVTLQKLAIAYYRIADSQPSDDLNQIQEGQNGEEP